MRFHDSICAMSQPETLRTRKEAASLLRVSLSTLERWERSGRLAPVRLSPGTIRYRRDDIDQLLEASA